MNIVCKLNTELINNNKIDKYHIIIDRNKLLEIYHDDDLRFFKNKNNMIQNILKEKNGIIVKISSWDFPYLKHSYIMSNKIKHKNFVKHYCYFEYEENILNNSEYLYEDYENSAIVFIPFYEPIQNFDFKQMQQIDFYKCIKQIILALYHSYFNSRVQFNEITLENIYIEYNHDKEKLKYKITTKEQIIETNFIVKIDAYVHSEIITELFPYHYKRLYNNIETILRRFPEIYNLKNIIDTIHDFNSNSQNIVHPFKSLDTILSAIY